MLRKIFQAPMRFNVLYTWVCNFSPNHFWKQRDVHPYSPPHSVACKRIHTILPILLSNCNLYLQPKPSTEMALKVFALKINIIEKNYEIVQCTYIFLSTSVLVYVVSALYISKV